MNYVSPEKHKEIEGAIERAALFRDHVASTAESDLVLLADEVLRLKALLVTAVLRRRGAVQRKKRMQGKL